MKTILPDVLPNRIDGIETEEQIGSGTLQSVKREIIKKHLKGQKILDLGCGAGDISKGLGDVTGVDVSEKRLAQAAKNGLKTIKADVCNVPLNEQFDAVLLTDIIEHVQRPYDLLMGAHRLLKPGGQLFLETPNAMNFARFLNLVFSPKTREESPNHLYLFDRISLTEMLTRTDFIVDKIHYIGFTFPGWRSVTDVAVKAAGKDKKRKEGKLSMVSRVGWFLGKVFKPFAYTLILVAHKKTETEDVDDSG